MIDRLVAQKQSFFRKKLACVNQASFLCVLEFVISVFQVCNFAHIGMPDHCTDYKPFWLLEQFELDIFI